MEVKNGPIVKETTWMSQDVDKWLGSMGYFHLLINGGILGL